MHRDIRNGLKKGLSERTADRHVSEGRGRRQTYELLHVCVSMRDQGSSTRWRNPPKIRPVTSGTDGETIGNADKLSIEF